MVKIIMETFYASLVKLNRFQFKYRTIISFAIVLIGIIYSDLFFHQNFQLITNYLDTTFGISMVDHENVPLDWAPEIWGGVLAMVLGTLIIVIAIAAESSPKLMDLFVKDWLSLLYVWFLIIASLHATLNSYVYLLVGSAFTLPYIFYILLYSKTSNVVSTISSLIQGYIFEMEKPMIKSAMNGSKDVVEEYQKEIMGSLDQLDDLLAFTSFKETPWPTTDVDFWRGDVANMSPKDARDFLNPLVPTLAILLLVNASSVVAALRPVSEV